MKGRMLWIAGCVAGLAGVAGAQEASIPPPKETWKLQFEPAVSFGAPGGDITLPGMTGGDTSTDINDLNLDGSRASPAGELLLSSGPWTFVLGGYRLDTGDQNQAAIGAGQIGPVSYSEGQMLTSSLTFTAVEAAVMRKIELPDSLNGSSGKDFVARLDVLGGLRVYNVDFDFAAPGGSTSASGFFGHPMIGAKLTMEIVEKFTVDAQVDLGALPTGSDSLSLGYDITAGFMWHPTQNVGVQIGYRDLAFLLRKGADGDRFEYDGAIQGLYFGAVIRF